MKVSFGSCTLKTVRSGFSLPVWLFFACVIITACVIILCLCYYSLLSPQYEWSFGGYGSCAEEQQKVRSPQYEWSFNGYGNGAEDRQKVRSPQYEWSIGGYGNGAEEQQKVRSPHVQVVIAWLLQLTLLWLPSGHLVVKAMAQAECNDLCIALSNYLCNNALLCLIINAIYIASNRSQILALPVVKHPATVQ